MDYVLIAINAACLPFGWQSTWRCSLAGSFLHIIVKILMKKYSEKACDCVICVSI